MLRRLLLLLLLCGCSFGNARRERDTKKSLAYPHQRSRTHTVYWGGTGGCTEATRLGIFYFYQWRKFEVAFGVAVRAAVALGGLPYFEVHILASEEANGGIPEHLQRAEVVKAWARVLPSAIHVGFHEVPWNHPSALARPWTHHGGYMSKIHEMVQVSRARNLSHMLKVDDDLLFEPAGLAAYLRAACYLRQRRKCSFLGPLVSTGIPSVELFSRRYYSPEEQAELGRCFSSVTMPEQPWQVYESNLSTLNPLPEPWNGSEFYRRVALLSTPLKGVHPVRLNNGTCSAIAARLVSELLERAENVLVPPVVNFEIDIPDPPYPYLCSMIWLSRRDDFERMLASRANFIYRSEEIYMAQWNKRMHRQTCFVHPTLVVHTGYRFKGLQAWEERSYAAMMSYLGRYYPSAFYATTEA